MYFFALCFADFSKSEITIIGSSCAIERSKCILFHFFETTIFWLLISFSVKTYLNQAQLNPTANFEQQHLVKKTS